MAIYPFDFTDLAEPNLLIPGKKPIGPVAVSADLNTRWILFPERKISGVIGAKQTPIFSSNESTTYNYPVVEAGNLFNSANQGMISELIAYDYVFTNLNASVGTSDDFTLMVHFKHNYDGGTYQYLFGSNTASSLLSVPVRHNGISLQFGIYLGASSSYIHGSGEVLVAGNEYVAIIRRSNGTLNFFLNGAKTAGSASNSQSGGSATQLAINSYQPAGGFGTSVVAYMIGFFDTGFSDGQCIELTRNPYLIFEPA